MPSSYCSDRTVWQNFILVQKEAHAMFIPISCYGTVKGRVNDRNHELAHTVIAAGGVLGGPSDPNTMMT